MDQAAEHRQGPRLLASATSSTPPRTRTPRRPRFYNFPTYNSVFMTMQHAHQLRPRRASSTRSSTRSWCRQLAQAIRRADANLGPGQRRLGRDAASTTSPQNRSLEAHLADHGIHLALREGQGQRRPEGPLHTIDPEVQRAARGQDHRRAATCRSACGRRSPTTAPSTTTSSPITTRTTTGPATHLVERRDPAAREACPRARTWSMPTATPTRATCPSGLDKLGPRRRRTTSARVEARAFMARLAPGRERTWTAPPPSTRRWTRMCFCGQQTAAGPVADQGVVRRRRSSPARRRAAGRSTTTHTGDPVRGRPPAGPAPARRATRSRRRLPLDRAARRPADRAPGRRSHGRLRPRRDDRGDGPQGAQAAVDAGRRRPWRRPRRDLRPRERVRGLLHDPRGVRRPALRGRARRSMAAPARSRSRRRSCS